jgi:hypothetical protein
MEKTQSQKIDLKQREHLVSLIRDARNREQAQLEGEDKVSEDSILREHAQEKGYFQSVKELRSLNEKIEELEGQRDKIGKRLNSFGFDVSNSGFHLRRWDAPDSLRDLVDKKLESARRLIQKSLKKYDVAIASIWIAGSSEDLQKVVEGVI